MAATKKGVWDLQDVRDKQLASEWAYEAGGALWVWGANTRGMFGLNQSQASFPSASSPTQVGTDTSWYKFAKGDGSYTWQTGAVKIDGTLWSWGYNSKGTLGHNNTTTVSSPTQVGTDTTWNNMATDREVMAAVKTDGTLWIWGYNNDGKLGLNQAYPGLNNISSPTQIPGTTWREAACDYDSVLATKTDGTLWAWGSGFYGELGQNKKGTPAHRSSPVQIPGTNWSQKAQGNSGYGAASIALKQSD